MDVSAVFTGCDSSSHCPCLSQSACPLCLWYRSHICLLLIRGFSLPNVSHFCTPPAFPHPSSWFSSQAAMSLCLAIGLVFFLSSCESRARNRTGCQLAWRTRSCRPSRPCLCWFTIRPPSPPHSLTFTCACKVDLSNLTPCTLLTLLCLTSRMFKKRGPSYHTAAISSSKPAEDKLFLQS